MLFVAAVALGQLVGAGQLDEQTARDRLRDACTRHLLDPSFKCCVPIARVDVCRVHAWLRLDLVVTHAMNVKPRSA